MNSVPASALSHLPQEGDKKKDIQIIKKSKKRMNKAAKFVESRREGGKDIIELPNRFHSGDIEWGHLVIHAHRNSFRATVATKK